jgi:hypothetical protein
MKRLLILLTLASTSVFATGQKSVNARMTDTKVGLKSCETRVECRVYVETALSLGMSETQIVEVLKSKVSSLDEKAENILNQIF